MGAQDTREQEEQGGTQEPEELEELRDTREQEDIQVAETLEQLGWAEAMRAVQLDR